MPSADVVCADTSAWIEYLRDSHHPVVHVTRDLLLTAKVCLADVVIGELLQGVRHTKERAIIEEFITTLPVLSGTTDTWKAAGYLSNQLTLRGKTSSLVDCYLASLAAAHDVAFLTCDRHFHSIQGALPRLQLRLMTGSTGTR